MSLADLETQYKNLGLKERMELAVAEPLDPAYRRFIICDQWMQIRCYFARRADLTATEIALLGADEDHVIRLCVAKRDDLPADMVEKFVADRDPNVRYFIARNPLVTPAQQLELLQDKDELVRQAAKKGPRAVAFRQRPGQAKLVK